MMVRSVGFNFSHKTRTDIGIQAVIGVFRATKWFRWAKP